VIFAHKSMHTKVRGCSAAILARKTQCPSCMGAMQGREAKDMKLGLLGGATRGSGGSEPVNTRHHCCDWGQRGLGVFCFGVSVSRWHSTLPPIITPSSLVVKATLSAFSAVISHILVFSPLPKKTRQVNC